MRPRVLTSEHELEELRPEWEALWERCPWSTPFQSPAWQLAWWHHLGGRGARLRVIVLRHDGRLVGLAPFFLYGMSGEPRRLALLGAGLADYDDVLLDADLAARGTALFARELAAWRDEWDACAIDELRPDSPLLDVPFPSTIRAERAPSSVCPVISLPAPLGAGATVAALEPAMSPSHRRKLRLSHNRLERAGGGTFAYAGEHDWQAVFDTLIRLHEHRWRDRGEPGVLADPRVREMHREIVPAFLARGCLRLAGLWLDRELVAVLYGVAWHGRTYCYLQGIAPHAAYYSPGVALLRFVIEQAIAEGGHEVDLLRGAESYKYLWGATDRRNHALHLEPAVSSPPSRSPAPATLGDKELL